MDAITVRTKILEKVPSGTIKAEHTEDGHFYRMGSRVLPSVTKKLKIIKDESLMNWKMNRALDYVFAHYKEFTAENVMEQLDKAKLVPVQEFEEAGDLGSKVHEARYLYFQAWIKENARPESTRLVDYSPSGSQDPRVVSAWRAFMKFLDDYRYEPIVCEMYVGDLALGVGGTLDDIGLISVPVRNGDPECTHSMVRLNCVKCDFKLKKTLVLMDLKTSNQYKNHYHLQVALYFYMFVRLTGIRPKQAFILKLSKDDGTYSVEHLTNLPALVRYGKLAVHLDEGLEVIQDLRKKKVITV